MVSLLALRGTCRTKKWLVDRPFGARVAPKMIQKISAFLNEMGEIALADGFSRRLRFILGKRMMVMIKFMHYLNKYFIYVCIYWFIALYFLPHSLLV